MKKFNYTPNGTCSRNIEISLNDDNTIADIVFTGGCHGNLQGIGALTRGMTIKEVISRLKGINCRDKATSCPDQLACALQAINEGALG